MQRQTGAARAATLARVRAAIKAPLHLRVERRPGGVWLASCSVWPGVKFVATTKRGAMRGLLRAIAWRALRDAGLARAAAVVART